MRYISSLTFKFAKSFFLLESHRIVFTFLTKTKTLPCFFRLFLLNKRDNLFLPSPILQCISTSRSQFVLSQFNLARLRLKERISNAYVPGVRKAS